jgi:hypothetical protein
MNANARKWIAALRSGEFKQGSNCLRNGDLFCCLGAACELYRLHAGGPEWDGGLYMEWSTVLPETVQAWLGLRSNTGIYSRSNKLALDNDSGKTFAEIADIIESEPPGLFIEETP